MLEIFQRIGRSACNTGGCPEGLFAAASKTGLGGVELIVSDHWNHPHLGFGLQLIGKQYYRVLTQPTTLDVFEMILENIYESRGFTLYTMDQLAERGQLLLHGVGLSIGSTDALDREHLRQVKALLRRARARFVSDHLCWNGAAGRRLHDFLPIPYTEEGLDNTVRRVREVQDFLEVPLILENVSTYLDYRANTMGEGEFMARLATEADCGLLVDPDAIYVSAYNNGFDPCAYIDALPPERIALYHVAGHVDHHGMKRDNHGAAPIDEVLRLYRYCVARSGPRTTCLAWDTDTPAIEDLEREVQRLREQAEQPMPRWEGAPAVPPERMSGAPPGEPRLPLETIERTIVDFIISPSVEPGHAAEELVRSSEWRSARQRLDVHRTQYWGRWPVELGYYFPHVLRLVGRDKFRSLAHRYIVQHPPAHANIFRIRDHFVKFLRALPDGEVAAREFVEDLARLEKATREMYDEAEVAVASGEALGPIMTQTEQVRLRFAPATRLLAFRHRVAEYSDGDGAPEANLEPQRNWLLLYRHQFIVQRLVLDERAYRLLRLLARGVPLGAALRRALREHGPEVHQQMALFVRVLGDRGLYESVSVASAAGR